jgi:hypothetical protein
LKDPNLGKRLAYWAHQLRCNKTYPWLGSGIVRDLEAAAIAQGAQLLTDPSIPQAQQTSTEYDL